MCFKTQLDTQQAPTPKAAMLRGLPPKVVTELHKVVRQGMEVLQGLRQGTEVHKGLKVLHQDHTLAMGLSR